MILYKYIIKHFCDFEPECIKSTYPPLSLKYEFKLVLPWMLLLLSLSWHRVLDANSTIMIHAMMIFILTISYVKHTMESLTRVSEIRLPVHSTPIVSRRTKLRVSRLKNPGVLRRISTWICGLERLMTRKVFVDVRKAEL